jgi:hypothetical protein
MASPTERTLPVPNERNAFFVDALHTRLEAAATNPDKEATPEPIYANSTIGPCYQLMCEQKRSNFTPDQSEEIRQKIRSSDYWQIEARALQAVAEKHNVAGSGLDHWRSMARAWASFLKSAGLSVDPIRQSIETQDYWELEAELFRIEANRQEMQLKEEWCRTGRRKVSRRQVKAAGEPRRRSQTRHRSAKASSQTDGVRKQPPRSCRMKR